VGLSVGDANLQLTRQILSINVHEEPFSADNAINSLSGVDRRVRVRKGHQPAAQDVFLFFHRNPASRLFPLIKRKCHTMAKYQSRTMSLRLPPALPMIPPAALFCTIRPVVQEPTALLQKRNDDRN